MASYNVWPLSSKGVKIIWYTNQLNTDPRTDAKQYAYFQRGHKIIFSNHHPLNVTDLSTVFHSTKDVVQYVINH